MAYHESSRKTFLAAGPIPQDCLVKLTSDGTVTVCEADEMPLGQTETGARAAGDHVAVRLMNTPGTMEVACSAVISVGQLVTTGANGEVVPHPGGADATSPVVGMALRAAVAGGVVEIVPVYNPIPAVSA